MPPDLPYFGVCYGWQRRLPQDGTWEAIHAALPKELRVAAARDPPPSGAIIDSPAVKPTHQGGACTAPMRASRY